MRCDMNTCRTLHTGWEEFSYNFEAGARAHTAVLVQTLHHTTRRPATEHPQINSRLKHMKLPE